MKWRPQNANKIFLGFTTLLIIFAFFWIFKLHIYPFIDLPLHLAESKIIKDYNNHDNYFSDYYEINSYLQPNQFHPVFIGLSIFKDLEFGNQVYISLYVFIYFFSIYLLVKEIKGSYIVIPLGILFLINHNVHWGFTGYFFSIPLLLIYIWALVKILNGINFYYILISILLMIIYYCHLQSFLTAILFLIVFNINKSSLKKSILSFLSSLPAVLLFLKYYSETNSKNGINDIVYLFNYYLDNYPTSIIERLKNLLIIDNFFWFNSYLGVIYSLLLSSFLLVITIILFNNRGIKNFPDNLPSYNIYLLTVLICYAILPNNISGQNIIYERYTILIFLLIIIFISKYKKIIEQNSFVKISVIFISIIHSIVIFTYMYDFKTMNKGFNENLFPEDKSSVLTGIIDSDFRGREVYVHFPKYFTILKSGISTGISDYRFGLIKRKKDINEMPEYKEWSKCLPNLDSAYLNCKYVLTKTNYDIKIPNFTEIKKSGFWSLKMREK